MVRVNKGTALCYRLFDIADSVDLKRAGALLAGGATRVALTREGSQYVELSNAPLSVELGRRAVAFKSGPVEVEVGVRLYDHGALSVIVRVPFDGGRSLEELIPFADELYDSPALDLLAGELVKQLRGSLGPALQEPHLWDKTESYTVLLVQDLQGASTADELRAAPELARLLLGETKERALSAHETADVVGQSFSYTDRDLAVIDWNAAFLWEPTGSTDIADLLEMANAQLLELRYYDDVLDRELTRLYDEIEARKKGQGPLAIFRSPYKKLMRELMLTLIELSEFVERVENAIKIVGDVYLARVYEAALGQLRVMTWQAQVTRKQRLLTQTYELLKGEVDTARALTLEVMVVLLILFEILMALSRVLPH